MNYRTSDLQGQALDWAVAKCEYGHDVEYIYAHTATRNAYSTDWSQGGPIIEREGIELLCNLTADETRRFVNATADWRAAKRPIHREVRYYGPTPLVAAMRCYVASKLGDAVEVPDNLHPCLDPDHAGCYDCQPMPSNPSIND